MLVLHLVRKYYISWMKRLMLFDLWMMVELYICYETVSILLCLRVLERLEWLSKLVYPFRRPQWIEKSDFLVYLSPL